MEKFGLYLSVAISFFTLVKMFSVFVLKAYKYSSYNEFDLYFIDKYEKRILTFTNSLANRLITFLFILIAFTFSGIVFGGLLRDISEYVKFIRPLVIIIWVIIIILTVLSIYAFKYQKEELKVLSAAYMVMFFCILGIISTVIASMNNTTLLELSSDKIFWIFFWFSAFLYWRSINIMSNYNKSKNFNLVYEKTFINETPGEDLILDKILNENSMIYKSSNSKNFYIKNIYYTPNFEYAFQKFILVEVPDDKIQNNVVDTENIIDNNPTTK